MLVKPNNETNIMTLLQANIKKEEPVKMIITLDNLKKDECGRISSFKGKGKTKKHLMEMGLVKGSEIKVERIAPLGDPIEIKIKGYSLSLRKDDAKKIEIEIQ
ncbi:MAG: FeoA family protein [Methanomicrobiales archaeon]